MPLAITGTMLRATRAQEIAFYKHELVTVGECWTIQQVRARQFLLTFSRIYSYNTFFITQKIIIFFTGTKCKTVLNINYYNQTQNSLALNQFDKNYKHTWQPEIVVNSNRDTHRCRGNVCLCFPPSHVTLLRLSRNQCEVITSRYQRQARDL